MVEKVANNLEIALFSNHATISGYIRMGPEPHGLAGTDLFHSRTLRRQPESEPLVSRRKAGGSPVAQALLTGWHSGPDLEGRDPNLDQCIGRGKALVVKVSGLCEYYIRYLNQGS